MEVVISHSLLIFKGQLSIFSFLSGNIPNTKHEIYNILESNTMYMPYLQARYININISTIIRTANMKNSEAWSSNALASATMMTMMFPKATVRSQAAWSTDFILSGA